MTTPGAEPRSASPAAGALLERAGELERLHALVARGRALGIVEGTAGIGKTALLARLGDRLAETRSLRARGGELEREFPYGVCRQLLEPALGACSESRRAELLSGPAAPVGTLLGVLPGPAADSTAIDHAFYWVVANLAEDGPLVLVVDDAHWADPTSLRALLYLTRRLSSVSAAVVIAARPDATGPAALVLDRLRDEAAERIQLRGLSDHAVSELVRERLLDADQAFSAACATATGGNPFLLSELVTAVTAAGVVPTAANATRVRSIGTEAVARSVLLRVRGLGDAAVILTRAISVLGDDMRLDLASLLAEIDVREAVRVVDGLRELEILSTGARPRYVHSIVRAAIWDDIPPGERSRLHRMAAELLAGAGARAEVVASHLLGTDAGADLWVAEQLVAAALDPLTASAPETMTAYLERALAEDVPGLDRQPLLFMLGAARFQSPEGGAVEPLSAALELARAPVAQMEAARALATALVTENRADEAWSTLETWIDRLAAHADEAGALELLLAHRISVGGSSADGDIERIAGWAADPAGAGGLDRSRLALQGWAGLKTAQPAPTTGHRASVALSSGTLVTDDIWYATCELAAWTLMSTGRVTEALVRLDEAVDLLRSIGRLLRIGTLLTIRSEAHRRLGNLLLAEEDARISAEIVPADHVYGAPSHRARILALVDLGHADRAREVLTAHGYSHEIPPLPFGDQLWFARGYLRLAEGDLTGAVDDMLTFGAIDQEFGAGTPGYFPWRSAAAGALARLGERDRASDLAGAELDLARRVELPECEAAPLLVLAGLCSGDEQITLIERAGERLAGSGRLLHQAVAHLELGHALRVQRQRERAREPLRRALDLATKIGAGQVARRAQDELLASGARPRRTALRGAEALTPSERRVADLGAEGMTNRQIAQTLYVTPKTVEGHLRNCYSKLGVGGKAELGAALTGSGH